MSDIGIILLCTACHKQFDPVHHRPLCDCGREDAVWEPYLPVRHVPEDVIEKLRANELEANMRGGPRKLHGEELRRFQDPEPIEYDPAEDLIEPPPATGEELPDDFDAGEWA